MNICRNETARLVGMENNESNKCLKTLERVKGIEPSYSAWKAAALPLSYTRIWGDQLTRRAGGLTHPGIIGKPPGKPPETRRGRPSGLAKRPGCGRKHRRPAPLNSDRFAAYTLVSTNNERR